MLHAKPALLYNICIICFIEKRIGSAFYVSD